MRVRAVKRHVPIRRGDRFSLSRERLNEMLPLSEHCSGGAADFRDGRYDR